MAGVERAQGEQELVLHEEELRAGAEWRDAGSVHAQKRVSTYRVVDDVPVRVDEVVVDRVPAGVEDSGEIETLADGSVSIPIFEEELVVEKRTVLKERVIVRREVVSETRRIEADVRREHLELEADPGVELRIDE